MEYYDTDSIYRKTISRYNDILKVTSLTAEDTIRMKLFLNSFYGRMISCMHFTDGKEKIMREFIVAHDNGKPILILKDGVIAVKAESEYTCLYLSSGCTICCDDKYRDIVKALVK